MSGTKKRLETSQRKIGGARLSAENETLESPCPDRYRRTTSLSRPPARHASLSPHPDLPIRSRTDQPGFSRVPLHIQHAEAVLDVMPAQDLERDDQRVLHQVRIDGPVEDLDGTVVRGRGEEGVRPVVNDRSESLGMIPIGMRMRFRSVSPYGTRSKKRKPTLKSCKVSSSSPSRTNTTFYHNSR